MLFTGGQIESVGFRQMFKYSWKWTVHGDNSLFWNSLAH